MKKQLILSITLLLIFSLSCFAQSNVDTYQIEKLSEPEDLISAVSPEKLYERVKQNLVKISIKEDLVINESQPVLGGFLRAYKEHRPVTISPDIMWLLICQGFGQHVNNNAEELRDKFVNFKGQKELVVEREVTSGIDLASFPWESIFPEFVEKIANYTGEELTKTLSADFTTTTEASLIASQITIMESMKKFFKYRVVMVGCGIPSVTIEGTVADWQKILTKLDVLAQYDLDWWISELKPVIQEIINTKSGKFNKEFWMDMIRFHREGLYGSYNDIDGWLLKFYPYDKFGKRNDLKKLENINMGNYPPELVRVPFVLEVRSSDGASIKTMNMEFWAGFMGLYQNEDTYNLKPAIGWAINSLPQETVNE